MIVDHSVKGKYRDFLNSERGVQAYNNFKRILYGRDDSLLLALGQIVVDAVATGGRERLTVCDIGCGDGKRTLGILRRLHTESDLSFEVDLIEQSHALLQHLSPKSVEGFASLTVHEVMFEAAALSGTYDLVLMIHSIFALEGAAAITRVLSLVNSGGVLTIVSNAQNSFLGGLKRLVDKDYADRRFEIGDVIDSLAEQNIPFQEHFLETRWTIPKARLSKDLADIQDWLSLGRYQYLTVDLKLELLDYIKFHSQDTGQGRLFTETEHVLLISPP